VVAIDNNRRILSDSVVGQRALDLGYQKSVVSAVSRGLVMVMRLKVHTVVACRDGARFYRFALFSPNLTGAHLGARQYAGRGRYLRPARRLA